ncbi:MAG: hypothetical protein M1818_004249 [Claussenomyces sp. TS43310]|nr:MAG: hypothetical protein M1818_004249 [Claussenomyces sp. TS43310]
MNSHALDSYISVEPAGNLEGPSKHAVPKAPERARPRTYHSVPQTSDDIELENFQRGIQDGGSQASASTVHSDAQIPRDNNDLEMSRPASPAQENEGVDALQSFTSPYMNRYRMMAVCCMNFMGGLNDSAPGALIPYMEKHYSIGYAKVSLIFITNAIGFISAAFIVDAIRMRLGRARTLMISNAIMAVGYLPIVCTTPFPVVVCCFFLLGLGFAISLALGNVFAANLQRGTTMLGAMHGSYGLGGTIAPLAATAMVTTGGLIWNLYYLIPMSLAIFNIAFAGWSFWDYEKESTPALLTNVERVASRTQDAGPSEAPPSLSQPKNQFSGMARAFKNKIVILGALFIFAYQGAEVSISGWVISFLIQTRKGDPSSVGYVTSGFWGGITVGRFVLSAPAHKIGEQWSVYALVVGAIAFQLLVWFVPNVIGDAVAVSLVGLLLGPVYPCATAVFSKLINRNDQVSSLSVISAFGSSGGAVAPFTTGILAQAVGTFVLSPIAIGLFCAMLGCWFMLPNVRKRRE